MHKNSVKAYHAIKSEIPAKEREVLHMIKMYGPINGRMLDVRISGGHKRIKNLMDMGCIGIAYIADDSVTGRETNYYMWLTDKPKPVKTVRKNCKALDLGEFYDSAYITGIKDALFWAGYSKVEIEVAAKRVAEVQK